MSQLSLPVSLFSASSAASVAEALLQYLFCETSAVQYAWVLLQDDPIREYRVVAQWEAASQSILTEDQRPLILPADATQEWNGSALPNPSVYEKFPLFACGMQIGMFLVQWASEPHIALRSQLQDLADAAGILLHAYNRESLFRDLERSKQHWEATFDAMDELLFICDKQGRLLKVNRALAMRLGVTPRELLATPSRVYRIFQEVITQGLRLTSWVSEELKSTFEVRCQPVYDREQTLIGRVYILHDITERLRLENQMRQSEKLAVLGEMVSGIAHELNNPLTSIVGYSEALLNRSASNPETDRARLRKIGMEADRAALIVQNLLAFVRPPAATQAPLSLNEAVALTADLRAEHLANKQIELHLDLAPQLPQIKGCAHEIQQALLNLIDNAIHAIREYRSSGNITLATRYHEGDDSVWLSVTDDGHGILPEHRDKLLLPFFTTKRVGEGSGLGLSITYGILRAHGAKLSIRSEVGQGATFDIQFPLFANDVRQDASEREESGLERRIQKAPLQSPALHIAILDDEPLIRELLEESLIEQGNLAESFETPLQALETLEKTPFDVVLCDIKMPQMSGMEFYQELLRRRPEYAKRILFLTGDLLAPDTRRFLEETGSLYLTKPFKSEALRNQLASFAQDKKRIAA